MSDVTEDMVEAAWSREQAPVAQLITITSDADPTPIRACDWPGGLTSNGDVYPHFPFALSWAGAGRDTPFGQGRLSIANVDRRVEEACDAALQPPTIDLSLVRVEDPDVLERAILGARVPTVEGDAQRVSAVVRPRDFSQEPACARVYTPASAAGLF